MASRYMKRCLTSLFVVKEMQNKTTRRYGFTSTWMVIIKRDKRKISIGEHVRKLELSSVVGRYVKWGRSCGKQFFGSSIS